VDDSKLDVGAPIPGIPEDPTDIRVIKNRQHKVLQLNFYTRNRNGVVVKVDLVQVVHLRLPALVSLSSFNGGHERVGDGRDKIVILGSLGGRNFF